MWWLGAPLIVLLAGLFVSRHELVRRVVRSVAEEQLGVQVQVGSTGGRYLGSITLYDLVIAAPAPGMSAISIRSLTLDYSPAGLLGGQPDALHGLRLVGADVAIDGDVFDPAQFVAELDLPPLTVPDLVLEDCGVQAQQGGRSIYLEGLGARVPLQAWDAEDGTAVDVAVTRVSGEGLDEPGAELWAAFLAAGLLPPSLEVTLRLEGDQLHVDRLVSADQPLLEHAALDVGAARRGELVATAAFALDGTPTDVQLRMRERQAEIDLDMREVELPTLRSWLDGLRIPTDHLPHTGQLDLLAALSLPLDDPLSATGTLTLQGRTWAWPSSDDHDDTEDDVGQDDEDEAAAEGDHEDEDEVFVLSAVALEARLDESSLTFNRAALEAVDLHVDLAGTRLQLSPTPELSLNLTGDVKLPGMEPLEGLALAAVLQPDDDGRWGTDQLIAEHPAGELTLEGLQLPDLLGTTGAGRLELDLERLALTLAVEETGIELRQIALGWDPGAGVLDAELREGEFGSRGQELALRSPATIRWTPGRRLEIADTTFAGAGGELSFQADLSDPVAAGPTGSDPRGRLSLIARDLRPSSVLHTWWPDLPAIDELDRIDVELSGTLSQWSAAVALEAHGIHGLLAGPLDLALAGTLQPTSLELTELEVRADDHTLVSGTVSVPLRDTWPALDTADLGAELAFDLPGLEPLGLDTALSLTRAHGTLTASGRWPAPQLRVELQASGLDTKDVTLPDAARDGAATLAATLTDGLVEIQTLTLEAPAARLTASARSDGPWVFGLDDDGLPHVRVDRSATLEGNVDLSGTDSAWMVAALPGVRRAVGELGAQLQLSGTLEQPRLEGLVTVTEGQLGLQTSGVASMTHLNGSARLDGTGLTELDLRGELGAAPFRVSGRLTAEGRTPASLLGSTDGLRADISIEGDELLLYRAGGVKLRADTRLQLTGGWDDLELAGTVAITDGRIARHVSLLDMGSGDVGALLDQQVFSLRVPPLDTLRFDVALTSPEPLGIATSVVRGQARLDAHLGGTGATPQLSGALHVERSQIRLHLWMFLSDRISVQFAPQDLLNSELSGSARARILGYDVLAVTTGPIEAPEVRLSSVPALSQEELLDLVLTGQLPEETGTLGEDSRLVGGVAVYLGREFLSSVFRDDSTETAESMLNRFEVEAGRNVSRRGDETLEVRFRMLDDVFTDHDSVYIEVEQSEFDETNGSLRFVFRLK